MKTVKITATDEGYFLEHEFFFGSDLIRNAKFVPAEKVEDALKLLLAEVEKMISRAL